MHPELSRKDTVGCVRNCIDWLIDWLIDVRSVSTVQINPIQWRSQLFFHGGAVGWQLKMMGWQLKMMGWLPLAIKARIGIASSTHDNWAIEQLNKILKVLLGICYENSVIFYNQTEWQHCFSPYLIRRNFCSLGQ